MKSKRFAHPYKDHIDHREYARYLKNQINDEILSPRSPIQKPPLHHHVIAEIKKQRARSEPPTDQVLQKDKKPPGVRPTFNGDFLSIWEGFPANVIKKILRFLRFSSKFALAASCKTLRDSLEDQIWIDRFTHLTHVKALDQAVLLDNRDFLKNVCKSFHYQPKSTPVIFSPSMLEPKNPNIRSLIMNLWDFHSIKTGSMLSLCRLFADLAVNAFLLSYDSHSKKITLWMPNRTMNNINSSLIKVVCLKDSQELVSARFSGEEFLIIQTKEEVQKGNFNYEVAIINIRKALLNFTYANQEQRDYFRIEYQINSQSGFTSAVFPALNQPTFKLEEVQMEELSICSYEKERLLFYTKSSSSIFAVYNFNTRSIEAVHQLNNDQKILEVKIQQSKSHGESNDIFQGTFLTESLEIQSFAYNEETKGFTFKCLQESDQHFDHVFNCKTHQFAAFEDRGIIKTEYLIFLKGNTFYYLNLQSQNIVPLITVFPTHTEDVAFSKKVVRDRKVTSWHAFEDLFVLTFNNLEFALYQITPEGGRKSITQGFTSFLSDWKLSEKNRKKKEQTNPPYSYGLQSSKIPPTIFLSHCYLIIVNYPFESCSFNIFVAYLPELLILRSGSETSKVASKFLVKEKGVFDIVGTEELFGNPVEFFADCIKNGQQQFELAKLQDNNLLVRFGKWRFFLSLESELNFNREWSKERVTSDLWGEVTKIRVGSFQKEGHDRNKIEKQNIKKNPYIGLKTNPNHSQEVQEFVSKNPNRWERKEKAESSDDELSDEEQKGKGEEKRQQRKEKFREVIKKETFGKYQSSYSSSYIEFKHLSTDVDEKEWFLRKVDQRKEKKKKTFARKEKI